VKQLPLDLQREKSRLDSLREALPPFDDYEKRKLRILDQIKRGEIMPVLRRREK